MTNFHKYIILLTEYFLARTLTKFYKGTYVQQFYTNLLITISSKSFNVHFVNSYSVGRLVNGTIPLASAMEGSVKLTSPFTHIINLS